MGLDPNTSRNDFSRASEGTGCHSEALIKTSKLTTSERVTRRRVEVEGSRQVCEMTTPDLR